MLLTQVCFGKAFVLTLTQISCRPAEHGVNHRHRERERERERGEKKSRPSLVAFNSSLIIMSAVFFISAHIFSHPFPKIGPLARPLQSVFALLLFKDTIDLQNESRSLSAHCSGRTFLCV